jgi:signal transduction histidine kinase
MSSGGRDDTRSEQSPQATRERGSSSDSDTAEGSGRWSTEAARAREQGREEERRRLARELHDELGQALLGLKMNLVWLQHRVAADAPIGATGVADIREKLPALLELVERSIRTVTAIVTDLRPPTLEQLGLVAALEWQTESFARRTGLRCRFIRGADVQELDMGRATAVFRMYQEMLTNVERHARANHVVTSIQRLGSRLRLSVRDNGQGVPLSKTLEPSSFGLLGMRERATLLGGTLTIKGLPGRGTTVTATIPLENRRTRARDPRQGGDRDQGSGDR